MLAAAPECHKAIITNCLTPQFLIWGSGQQSTKKNGRSDKRSCAQCIAACYGSVMCQSAQGLRNPRHQAVVSTGEGGGGGGGGEYY